jgi:hypothetical protein
LDFYVIEAKPDKNLSQYHLQRTRRQANTKPRKFQSWRCQWIQPRKSSTYPYPRRDLALPVANFATDWTDGECLS